jgi:signal transduction histidine kinase
MLFRNAPLQKKIMGAIILISGVVLIVTCVSFFAYEIITFRQMTTKQLSVLGQIIATNSTAALAFDDRINANEILAALKAEKHVTQAALYEKGGSLFSHYPAESRIADFPSKPGKEAYFFEHNYLSGFQPVTQGNKYLGMLYIRSDMGAMYERLRLYGGISILVIAVSFLLAYILSNNIQKIISRPILSLVETARSISDLQDYSVRAEKMSNDELGLLTDSFNQMLGQIQKQNLEITSFNQLLEQKVMERTNELEIANKELESFTYSVSHDLRAPLRGIHSYSQILKEDHIEKLDEEGKRTIDVISKNSRKMGALIDDLLAFSRLGRKEVNSRDINMNFLATTVAEEFLSSSAENKIDISILPLLPSWGDQALIKQIWVNLISNAIKYSGKKPKTIIEIGSYRQEDMNVYYVKDNGVGFDMKYYDKLFGVFQRLHSQEEFEGTGVGLAISQRIIQKHHGKVWAESKLNEGTTFYFSLQTTQN